MNIIKIAMLVESYRPSSGPSRHWKQFFNSTDYYNWNILSDLSKGMPLHSWESLHMIYLISNQRQLIIITEWKNLLHVLVGENGAHWVGWIDDKHELSFFIDQGGCVFEIYLEILFDL